MLVFTELAPLSESARHSPAHAKGVNILQTRRGKPVAWMQASLILDGLLILKCVPDYSSWISVDIKRHESARLKPSHLTQDLAFLEEDRNGKDGTTWRLWRALLGCVTSRWCSCGARCNIITQRMKNSDRWDFHCLTRVQSGCHRHSSQLQVTELLWSEKLTHYPKDFNESSACFWLIATEE